jgi:hypothetical protein
MMFQVLTAAGIKMAVVWVLAPCTLIEVYRRFRGTCCLHDQGDDGVCKCTALDLEDSRI